MIFKKFFVLVSVVFGFSLFVLPSSLLADCQPELQLVRDQITVRSQSGNDDIINAGEDIDIQVNVVNNSFDCASGDYTLTYRYVVDTVDNYPGRIL